MGFIYKVTNTINGKVYIGLTKNPVKWRWHSHLYSAFNKETENYDVLFHRAIRKYGIDAFIVETIEECKNAVLPEREQYWIAHYNSSDGNFGYNMTLGGEGRAKYTDEEIMALWNDGYSASEIARLIPKSITRNTVRGRLLGMGVSQDEILRRGAEGIRRAKEKLIYQYSKEDGAFIQTFYSATYASKVVGCNLSNINGAANGAIKSAGGYLWSYEKHDRISIPKNQRGFTLVGKYSVDGILVEAYVSVTAAAKVNAISRKRLSIACDKNELYNGFIWKRLEVEGGIIHV